MTIKKTSTEKIPIKLNYEDVEFVDSTKSVWNYSLFTDEDITNFQNGTFYNAYNFFGSHKRTVLNTEGFYFAVWAPNATQISVVGDFNNWKKSIHPLFVRLDKSGIWANCEYGLGATGKTCSFKYWFLVAFSCISNILTFSSSKISNICFIKSL